MISYIITANPEKKLWEILRTDTVFNDIRRINDDNVCIITKGDNSIQLILLPDLKKNDGDEEISNENKQRVENYIESLNLKENKEVYLILHSNDFTGGEDIEKPTTDEPPSSPLFRYNSRIRYYTSERRIDTLYKYLVELYNDDNYFDKINCFFELETNS